MSFPSNPDQTRRLTRFAIYAAIAAQLIPLAYALYGITTPMFYRGPLFSEVRYLILVLGLLGALLGLLALIRRTNYKVKVVAAIVLGLAAPIWHVLLCGSNPLGPGILFCPMMWGIRIP